MPVEEVEKRLKREGIEVRADRATRTIYSVDASIYEVLPTAVAFPKSEGEVLSLVKIAREYRLPITARGAATGITGGAIGSGIILDMSLYLNKIIALNCEEEWVICQPGVVQDDLNSYLEKSGYRLGPDTSTGNRATIGGMVGNNAAGARSLYYGRMGDHLLEVKMALSSGELATFKREEALLADGRSEALNSLCRELLGVGERYREEIEKNFPKTPRRVSGYNLEALIGSGAPNLPELIAGSEGTLGVITEVKLRLVPRLKETALLLLFLDDAAKGFAAVEKILSYSPLSFEMIDDKIIESGRRAPSMRGKLGWLKGSPKAIFAVEFERERGDELKRAMEAFAADMQREGVCREMLTLYDGAEMAKVWALRKAGLGLLLAKRSYSRAIAFIEDLSVPPEKLAPFMEKFRQLLEKKGKEAGIYGHVGAGCMHIRPYIDLREPKELKIMEEIMVEVTSLIIEERGCLSGEHGDGLIRSWLNEKLFGKELYRAFIEVKEAFDKENLMNPGKIVNGPPLARDLRLSPEREVVEIETFLDFDKEGGFALSADLCNGNASCRKGELLMCPPFQATGNERETTRARAQMLRAIASGRLPREEFTGAGLYNVMDLCVECKGCKKECPSSVDMAKMKSEFLYHYHKKWGTPLRSRLFGQIAKVNAAASMAPKLFNALIASPLAKRALPLFGLAKERPLPPLAELPFSKGYRANGRKKSGAPPVTLFIDTYSEYNRVKLPEAALTLLEKVGYAPQIISRSCCGRPLISKGLLKEAKKAAEGLLQKLAASPYPIIALEPSCLSTLIDDYSFLLGKGQFKTWQSVASRSFSLEEFLLQQVDGDALAALFRGEKEERVYLHSHCHEKALSSKNATAELIKKLPRREIIEIKSGCCGLAGSFGYEKEHYPLSMAIGSLRLFPAIEAMEEEAALIANGFSCQCQIAHGTGRKALHLAEYLLQLLA